MSREYFGIARHEIVPHLPEHATRILELGCGTGATTALVKSLRPVVWAGGVEIVADAATVAGKICNEVWQGNVELEYFEKDITPGSIDLILCLDVLEHLVDPWAVMKRLTPLLSTRGRLIASIPNIRNWKFIRDLLFRGKFNYADAGLLDRTHLRFFVRETAIELVEAGGLRVTTATNANRWRSSDFRQILSRMTFGRLEGLMVKQWIIVAEQRKPPTTFH